MKKSIILLSILLGGCALIPTTFDSALYDHLVNISTAVDGMQEQCGTDFLPSSVPVLKIESSVIMKYTEFTSEDIHASYVLVDKNITELNSTYKKGIPSIAYCRMKLKIIDEDLRQILTAVGGKHK